MNVYLILLTSALAQFGAHFSDEWIDRTFGNGWAQLFAHAVGVLVSAPFLDMLMAEFDIPAKMRRLIMLLFFAVFFFGGLGTLLGWIARPSPNHNGNGAHK
jgi:hypothetical protein